MIELDQKKYLQRRRLDLAICLKALESDTFIEIENIGHKIKGNGTTFGFPELTAIGADLEVGARQQNKAHVARKVNEFKSWIESHSMLDVVSSAEDL